MPRIADWEVDEMGFLVDGEKWNTGFAVAAAPVNNISTSLTEKHWAVVNYIRQYKQDTGRCPLVYQACRANKLSFRELRRLFPSGYLRGACKLAGVTYREGYVSNPWSWTETPPTPLASHGKLDKVYRTDARGFLVDATEWDETFALCGAENMEIPGGLSDLHWRIIRWMRGYFVEKNVVPTVYETCEEMNIEIDELERLFPRGYHRGAVKLAGLRVR